MKYSKAISLDFNLTDYTRMVYLFPIRLYDGREYVLDNVATMKILVIEDPLEVEIQLQLESVALKDPKGPPGKIGKMGPVGANGEKGDKGDTGVVGQQGPVGPKGSTGPRGSQGAAGKIGPKGYKDDQGVPAVEIDIVAELCKHLPIAIVEQYHRDAYACYAINSMEDVELHDAARVQTIIDKGGHCNASQSDITRMATLSETRLNSNYVLNFHNDAYNMEANMHNFHYF